MRKKLVCIVILSISIFLCSCRTQKQIEKNIEVIISDYNSDKISYDDAYSEINSEYENADNDEKMKYINEQLELLERLKSSKDDFESANSAFEKADYEDAMKYYDLVIEEDTNYKTAGDKKKTSQDKYIEMIDAQAKVFIDDEKYLKTIELYESAKKVYDDGSLDKKISDIEENYRTNLETKAESHMQSEEWKEAIAAYNALYDYFKDEIYTINITSVKNSCINAAIEEAEDLLSQGNYTDAKVIVSSAKSSVGNDEELEEELERIESFVPVSLMELETFYTEGDIKPKVITGTFTDNVGNSYKNGIECSAYGKSSKKGNIAYLVNGEYNLLTGIFTLDNESKDSTDGEKTQIQMFVYGDDKLLYSSILMYGGIKPQDVSVDISGVQELRIEFEGFAEGGGLFWSNSINAAFVDPMISKTYKPLN